MSDNVSQFLTPRGKNILPLKLIQSPLQSSNNIHSYIHSRSFKTDAININCKNCDYKLYSLFF